MVEKIKKLEDGAHEGIITALEYREKPYEYVDVVIESKDVKIKAGYPKTMMIKSKLGELLIRFGAELKEGTTIDPDKVLIGKECKFTCVADGLYTKVIQESLKPKVATEEVK